MRKIIACALALVLLLASVSVFAMSTYDFDNGMQNGISYFNRGMYYEARDEFQWFCDYNWGDMNPGQQQYALDYLDGTKQKIMTIEGWVSVNDFYFDLIGKTKAQIEEVAGPQVGSTWYEGPLYYHQYTGNACFAFDEQIYRNDGSFYAPWDAKCTSIGTTVSEIIDMSYDQYNVLARLREVFDYKGVWYSELDRGYHCSFEYNEFYITIDLIEFDAPILLDNVVWISRA